MALYYPGCTDPDLTHVCLPCDIETEKGRVGDVAFIHKDYYATILADPTNVANWQTGITSKQIIVIPNVLGSYDGGSEQTANGYGRVQERLIGFAKILSFKDPAYVQNGVFYDELLKNNNYHAVFNSETRMHISKVPVQAIPKNPITENTTDDVVWDVAVKWQEAGVSIPYEIPAGIFTCFDFTP